MTRYKYNNLDLAKVTANKLVHVQSYTMTCMSNLLATRTQCAGTLQCEHIHKTSGLKTKQYVQSSSTSFLVLAE